MRPASSSNKYEVKVQTLGGGPNDSREIKLLNRTLRWEEQGISWEADKRHAQIVIEKLSLGNARGVSTPGTGDVDISEAEKG